MWVGSGWSPVRTRGGASSGGHRIWFPVPPVSSPSTQLCPERVSICSKWGLTWETPRAADLTEPSGSFFVTVLVPGWDDQGRVLQVASVSLQRVASGWWGLYVEARATSTRHGHQAVCGPCFLELMNAA